MKERRDKLNLRRAYSPPGVGDGCRILVDRVWPRGVSREKLGLDAWLKEIAPSHGLRKWFGHDPGRWDRFKEFYTHELEAKPELIERVLSECREGAVTLIFGAKDVSRNNAVVLKEYLEIRLSVDRDPR